MPQSLPSLLKSLRDRQSLTVKALARKCGLSEAVLYKAESSKKVAWSTIRQGYVPLTRDEREFTDLVATWARHHVGHDVDTDKLAEQVRAYRAAEAEQLAKEGFTSTIFTEVLAGMTTDERRDLLRLIALYAQSEATREMVAAWLRAVLEDTKIHDPLADRDENE